jgi:hypothetical protein
VPTLPAWLQDTSPLPLLCAQAREDSLQDLDLVRALDRPVRALVVGTSSCTAASLATLPNVVDIQVVDARPAQVALTRVKLRLLSSTPPAGRRAVLGHAPGLSIRQRRERLASLLDELELPADALGPAELVARWGVDYAGRLERAWTALRAALSSQHAEVQDLLRLSDLPEQLRRAGPSTLLGKALDEALKQVLCPSHVAALSDLDVSSSWPRHLAKSLARGIRETLERVPATANPYLWQLLWGRNPAELASPWLSAPTVARPPQQSYHAGSLREVVEQEGPGFDTIHLGDALDRLDPAEAQAVLEAASARLLPGGALLLRQLRPQPSSPAASSLAWDDDYAERLAEQSRSPFSRGLRVGRREG